MIKKIKKAFKKTKNKFEELIKTIKYVQRRTGNLCNFILFDMIWAKIIYGVNHNEYRIFEFFLIKRNKRKTYLSMKRHDFYSNILINKDILNILKNKEKLYKRLSSYLNRNVFTVNNVSFKEFEQLAYENKFVLARDNNSSFVKSYKIYDLSNYRSPAFMLEKIKKDDKHIVEKSFKQHKSLNEITDALVIVNLVTICTKKKTNVLAASLKFKDQDKIVRGFIDIKNANVVGHLKYENGSYFAKSVVNYEIPSLDKMVDLVKKLALELSEIQEIEWGLCVNNRGNVYLMDANVWKDTIYVQDPEYSTNRIGLKQKYKKC